MKKVLLPVLACVLLLCACDYIVLPEGALVSTTAKGWAGVVTEVGTANSGALRIGIAIRNETGDWSAMEAPANKPAVLTTGEGKSTSCNTVVVSTGGHRLAPGFQMRGFVGGSKAEPKVELLCIECAGVELTPGSKVSFDYSYYIGEYNYYDPEANRRNARMELALDEVAEEIEYPLAAPLDEPLPGPGTEIPAINDCVLTLSAVTRSEAGLQFTWQTSNPGEYPTYVHIGAPPVIGDDGIIYGLYESPHLASVPVTGAGQTAEWTTDVAVPKQVGGLYVLLSVESKKQRLFTNYAIDIGE